MNASIVLAGGAGRRMGGVDKAALRVGKATLLDIVVAAARPLCARVVVVGPVRPTAAEVSFTMEERPGGGPVPAVRAGLAETGPAEVIVLLAVDLPFLSTRGIRQLLSALDRHGAGAAAAADHRGRPNPLLAAFRADVLHGAAGRLGGGGGTAASLLLPDDTVTVPLGDSETLNVNTPSDLATAVSAARRS